MSENSYIHMNSYDVGGSSLSSSFATSRYGEKSRPSIDWDRITNEVELRTTHLLNTSRSFSAHIDTRVPPLPPKTPIDPNETTKTPSDFITRLRQEEENRIKEEKNNDLLRGEIDALKITGTQQRERIMQLEANVAELTAMYKDLKLQSSDHVSAQKSLATQLYTMNESWVGTSSDLKIQVNNYKQLEQRIWNMEQDHTNPLEIRQIEINQKDLQEQLKEVSATADAASLRGYQTAFFSDTLLAALEEIYKGQDIHRKEVGDADRFAFSNADQSSQEPSRAVKDMVSLMNSAMQSAAARAMHNDEKLQDNIKSIIDPLVRTQVGDTIKALQEENDKTKYPKLHSDLRKDLSTSIAEDPNFVQKLTVSVRSAIPPAVEEIDFMRKVESVVNPIITRKVENKTSELLKETAVENEDVRLRIARLDDGLAANKILVEQVMERQLQLPTQISNTPTALTSQSNTAIVNESISMEASPKTESSSGSKGSKGTRSFSKSPRNKAKATTTDEDEDVASIARLRASRDKAEMRTETKSLLDHEVKKLRSEMHENVNRLDTDVKYDLNRMDTDIKQKTDKIDLQLKENIVKLENRLEKRILDLVEAGKNAENDSCDEISKSSVANDITTLTASVSELLMARETSNQQINSLKDRVDTLVSNHTTRQDIQLIEKKYDGCLKSVQECLDVLQEELTDMDVKIGNMPLISSDTSTVKDHNKSMIPPSSHTHQLHAPLASPPAAVVAAEALAHAKQHEDGISAEGTASEEGAPEEQIREESVTTMGREVSKSEESKEDTNVEVEDIPNVEDYSEDKHNEVSEMGNRNVNNTDIEQSNQKGRQDAPEAPKAMNVFVKTFVGKIIPLTVDQEDRISSIKSKIEAKEDMVAVSQRLIFNGQEMMDFGCISDYGIVADSTIHLKLKMPSTTSVISVNTRNRNFSVDDVVEGRFSGGSKWFKGIIKGAHDNGTYQILYDDGDEEDFVPADCIRYLKEKSPRASPRGSGSGGFSREPSPRKGGTQSSPLAGLRMKASPVLQPISVSPKQPSPKHKRSPKGVSPSSKPFAEDNAQLNDGNLSQPINLEDSMDSIGSLGELVLPARVKKLQEKRRKNDAHAQLLEQKTKNIEQEENIEVEEAEKKKGTATKSDAGDVILNEKEKLIDHSHLPTSTPPVRLEQAEHELQEMIEHPSAAPLPLEIEETQSKEKTSETIEHPEAAPLPFEDKGENQGKEKTSETIEHPEAAPLPLQDKDENQGTEKSLNDQSDSNATEYSSEILFQKNDDVLAIFEAKLGRTRWFPGKIAECNIDGTYDIAFNDGDAESGVSPQYIVAVVDDEASPLPSAERSPRPRAAEGLILDVSNSSHTNEATIVNSLATSTNQEPSPSVDLKQDGNSMNVTDESHDENDEFSIDNVSVPSEEDNALHEFDTDSDVDELEASSETDPAMKGISTHLRRGTAQEIKSYDINEDKEAERFDADDASRSLQEPGTESDFSNVSTPSKPANSPKAEGVERSADGDALSDVMGAHDVRARHIRHLSPRNATPGSSTRGRGFGDSKDVEDEKYQEETNKALENMDTSMDTDEDERILEGTGRENIWDRIQLSSGKRASGSEHILSSPKHGKAPPSPFSQIASSLSRDTPMKKHTRDTEDFKDNGKSENDKSVSSSSGGDDGDAEGPATSPGKDLPSTMLTEALKNLQSDPSKTAAAARAMMAESSPEPVLTGVLRRRQAPMKNLPSSSTVASAKVSNLSSSPSKRPEKKKRAEEKVNTSDGNLIKATTIENSVGDADDEESYNAEAIREATRRAINASVSAVKYSEAREAAMGSGYNADVDALAARIIPTIDEVPVPKMAGSSQCTFCLKKIQNSEMGAHLKVCTLRYENCKDCGMKVRYIKLKYHLSNECNMRSTINEGDNEDEDEIEEDLIIPANESKDYDDDIVDRDI